MRRGLALCGLALLAACKQENELIGRNSGLIATTVGDFDDVGAPFDRMVVDHQAYEGLISTATWDDTYNPDNVTLKVETLFGTGQEIDKFGTVFVASGTRGLGLRQYNGLDPDSEFVADPYVIGEIQNYKGTLVCTDWSYDLIEQAFPDFLDFLGDDTTFDAAQAGDIGVVPANVLDDRLVEAIGEDVMSVNFDFSNWAVMESLDEDNVDVWLEADQISYRVRDGEGEQTLNDVPLLVSFTPNGPEGIRIVFSSFHIDAQTPAVMDQLLRTVVGKFDEKKDDPVAPIE
jgi:hypothetical protein